MNNLDVIDLISNKIECQKNIYSNLSELSHSHKLEHKSVFNTDDKFDAVLHHTYRAQERIYKEECKAMDEILELLKELKEQEIREYTELYESSKDNIPYPGLI